MNRINALLESFWIIVFAQSLSFYITGLNGIHRDIVLGKLHRNGFHKAVHTPF